MRAFEGTFTETTTDDIAFVAANMREADRRELKRWTGQEPAYELEWSVKCSRFCRTARFKDGQIACIFGACPSNILESTATIWSLSTAAVNSHPLEFMRGSLVGLDLLFREMSNCAVFENFIDCEYQGAIKWLYRLGFDEEIKSVHRAGLRGGDFVKLYSINPYYKED